MFEAYLIEARARAHEREARERGGAGARGVRPLPPPSLAELRDTPFDGEEWEDELRNLLEGGL